MDSEAQLVAAWLLLWIAAITGGIVLIAKKRRSPGIPLVIVGGLVLVVPLAAIGWWTSSLSDPTVVQVYGLDPRNDEGLTIHVRNSSDMRTETEWSFQVAGGIQHVVGIFDEQHPDGIDTSESPQMLASGAESVWHISRDDVRYDLITGNSPDWYELETQVVVVLPQGAGPDVRIPFPRSAFDLTEVHEGVAQRSDWDSEQWAAFYADIPTVHVDGTTITVPTNQDGTATITLTEGAAVVTINN